MLAVAEVLVGAREKGVAGRAKLVKVVGDVPWEEFPLPEEGETVIGRDRRLANVVLEDPTVSREHATIFVTPAGYVIKDGRDEPSRNGTFVNGVRITEKVLAPGDKIKIRHWVLEFASTAKDELVGTATDVSVIRDDPSQASGRVEESIDAQEGSGASEGALVDLDEVQRTEMRLRTFYDVSQAIGVTLTLDVLLNQVMASLFRVFTQAERGFVMLQEADGSGKLEPAVVRKAGSHPDAQITVSQTIIDEVMTKKVAVLSRDALSDDRFRGGQSISSFNIRSVMCAPLVCQGEVLGIIHIDTTSSIDSFDREDLRLLNGIASQAAISIKNAQLLEEVRREVELRSNLARYMSPAFVEQVLSGSRALDLGGRLSQGTVLFSDIVGFTSMTLMMRPEEVVKRLNRYFEIMVEVIFVNGGSIDKFGGDAIIAVWGAPVPSEDDAFFAAKAALEMQNALFGFNYGLLQDGLTPVEMGIGLNSGTFLAGNIGSSRRMEYTIIGENVNLANRIEDVTTERQVYISQSTFEQVAGRVVAFRMPPTELKGVEAPMAIYSVKGAVLTSGETEEHLVLSFPVVIITAGEEATPGQITGAELDVMGGQATFTLLCTRPLEVGARVGCALDVPEVIELPSLEGVVESVEERSAHSAATYAEVRVKVEELPAVLHRLIYSRQTLAAEPPQHLVETE